MKTLRFIAVILVAVLLTGCSKKKKFAVLGEIEGIGMQMVTATYYADGGLKRVTTSSSDNKFVIIGSSKKPTLVSVALSDGTPIADLIIENGDKAKLTGSITEPHSIKVSGNGDSEKMNKWINEHAEMLMRRDVAGINSELARWVGKNRSSKAATALMLIHFQTDGYEHLADSLMSLIKASARTPEVMQNFNGVLSAQLSALSLKEVPVLHLFTSTDSVLAFNPRAQKALLLCFMSDNPGARDSVSRQLRELTSLYPQTRFRAVEISTVSDSAAWRNSIARDSATWKQTWAPATVASTSIRELAVPRTPYFIVADSVGNQVYRGTSITAARTAAEKRLR